MELEESKSRLEYINRWYEAGYIYSRTDLQAIETVLQALEESIPKKVIEDKIEELKEYIITLEKQQNEIISLGGDDLHIREQIWEVEEQIKILQDLLKGEKE